MFELYDKVINWEYVRNKGIYEQINAEYIPFEENGQLKQITEAIIDQSFDDLENVTNSLGFYLDYGNGKKVLTPLSQVYTKYLDAACYDRKRDWSVVPDNSGDGTDALIYKGSLKANGEKIKGTATTTDNWQTCTFEAD